MKRKLKFASWLKKAKAEKSLTLRQIADACGCSEAHVCDIISGRRVAELNLATKICDLFNQDVDAFEIKIKHAVVP